MATADAIGQSLPKGFTKLSTEPLARRLIVAVSGREKQGKSHFALTAPGPIAYFDLDIGTEGVVNKFVDAGKTIYLKDYDYHALQDKSVGPVPATKFLELWEQLRQDYIAAMDSKVRTVVMDTATEVWELLRMSRFGKLDHVMPHHYGPVNAEYRALLRLAYMSNKNLILLHKSKKEYVNDKYSGKYERAGFTDTGFMVQVNVTCWRKLNGDNQLEFGLTIDDCRQNADVAGLELVQPMCTFHTMASMITGEDEGKWK